MLSKRVLISKLSELCSQRVVIAGFVEGMRKFKNSTVLVVRDTSGFISVSFSLDNLKPNYVTRESVVLIEGIPNKEIKGQLELEGKTLELLSKAKAIPIDLREEQVSEEKYRMRYRYLDLRRKSLKNNLIFSSQAKFFASEYLNSLGFIEVNTPILSFPTKEGANTFSTFTNEQVKESFTLAQSPQLYKQLLMISGFESYYQFSRSFRAEKLREDRQYEFTQLDIEMSFSTTQKLFEIIENLLILLISKLLGIQLERQDFKRMTYHEALMKFGTDKPDLRNPLVIQNWESTGNTKEIYHYIVFRGTELETTLLTSLLGKKYKYICKSSSGELEGDEIDELIDEFVNSLDLSRNSYVFYRKSYEKFDQKSLYLLGELRNKLFNLIPIKQEAKSFKFVWIVDWNYFERNSKGELTTTHHPFTLPIKSNNEDIMGWKSKGYDLVLNGVEIASGSERITNQELQKEIFKLLGHSEESINKEFGWFLQSLEFGVPPHLGIAIGWERLIKELLGLKSIREVIAFPKNSHGVCSMSSLRPLS